MARPLRIEYAGAVYHVKAPGNQGQPIFRDDEDRRRFLATLGKPVRARLAGPGNPSRPVVSGACEWRLPRALRPVGVHNGSAAG